jgi:hypothetical protein
MASGNQFSNSCDISGEVPDTVRAAKKIESLHNKGFSIGMRAFPSPDVDQAYIKLCKPATFFMISV